MSETRERMRGAKEDGTGMRIAALEAEIARLKEALTGKLCEDDAGNEFTYVMVLKEEVAKLKESDRIAADNELKRLLQYETELTRLRSCLELAEGALGKAKIHLEYTAHTSMLIRVRELDGSISTQRPESNEGAAFRIVNEAITDIKKLKEGV